MENSNLSGQEIYQRINHNIQQVMKGLGIIATQSSAPVWPVFIETNSDYLSKGWPLWHLPDKKIRMRITLVEPLASPPDESAAEFTKRLREVFLAALGNGSNL